MFINQIDHTNYIHIVETLKAIPNYTLKDYYHEVNAKSQDIEYLKPYDKDTILTPRSIGIRVPTAPLDYPCRSRLEYLQT